MICGYLAFTASIKPDGKDHSRFSKSNVDRDDWLSLPVLLTQGMNGDIKSYRLVCRAFNSAATPFLLKTLETIHISFAERDIKALEFLASHPGLSNNVKHIVYDWRMYEHAVSDESLGFGRYIDINHLSCTDRNTKRARPTRGGDHRFCKKEVLSHEAQWAAYRDLFDKEDRILADNSRYKIVESLRALVNVKTVSMGSKSRHVAGWETRDTDHRLNKVDVLPPDSLIYDGKQATTLSRLDQQLRIFNAREEFFYMVNLSGIMDNLTSLRLEVGVCLKRQETLVQWYGMFGSIDEAEKVLAKLLPKLTHLDLVLNPQIAWVISVDTEKVSLQQEENIAWGKLMAKSLKLATNLERFTYDGFTTLQTPEFSFFEIFDPKSLPKLKVLQLQGMKLDIDELMVFLEPRRGVLKSLCLKNVRPNILVQNYHETRVCE